jgi:pyrroline-5-carboxylate reductase
MYTMGFTGYGSMGSTIIEGLLGAGALAAGDVAVSTRTPAKLARLTARYFGVRVFKSNRELAGM